MFVRVVYNLLMTVGVIVFSPLIFVKVILTPKYRHRFAGRLGLGPGPETGAVSSAVPRIWLHALSVGEVASARTLVRELRRAYPEGVLFFSATTSAGEDFARASLGQDVDFFVSSPFDLPWSVHRIVSRVRPDLFVLVETDFWPNILAELGRRGVPCLLVNGRISERSFRSYRRLRWFFSPLFSSFRYLAMQTEQDAENMRRLGMEAGKLRVLGNLKYDSVRPDGQAVTVARSALGISPKARLWVAGSTHPGEEVVLFEALSRLVSPFPDLVLVVAPRNISRGPELRRLATRYGFAAGCRSESGSFVSGVLILDSLGELASLYSLCDLAFIGGSLVPERGHNPLEPVVYGKPVFFGPHMEDFAEISRDLLAAGAAGQVRHSGEMVAFVSRLLADAACRRRMADMGKKVLDARKGVTARHLALISEVLGARGGR
jgi:3-deoxy-D-manno-octulosonic-acid transferase